MKNAPMLAVRRGQGKRGTLPNKEEREKKKMTCQGKSGAGEEAVGKERLRKDEKKKSYIFLSFIQKKREGLFSGRREEKPGFSGAERQKLRKMDGF